MRGDPWTRENDYDLRSLAEKGYSGTAIGKAIGRSRNAIIGRARRQGVQLRGIIRSDLSLYRAANVPSWVPQKIHSGYLLVLRHRGIEQATAMARYYVQTIAGRA